MEQMEVPEVSELGRGGWKYKRWTKWMELIGGGWNSFRYILFIVHVRPSGDRLGGQAVIEHYIINFVDMIVINWW
jgi:hypothetical protein